jgi:hypothetical protein
MAYASRRFIRTALKQVIESEKAAPGEKLKAAELLWKMRNLAPSPSRGKFKPSKLQAVTKSPQNGIDQILHQIQQ